MASTYGVFVDDADAQTQLLALTRSMFPTPTLQGGDGNKVGAVLPRLRDTLQNNHD